ncbi:MAG: hypothetical protein ACTSPY_16805 [Candidatus Helarchaeota archaeon]
MNRLLLFELGSLKEFIIGISYTPGLYMNYLRVKNKHIYFHIVSFGSDLDKALYYCTLDEKLPFNWINFNPRTFEIKFVPRPINSANYNISIIECKKMSYINDLVEFMNS